MEHSFKKFFRDKRVLVTGHTGFKGGMAQHLAQRAWCKSIWIFIGSSIATQYL